MRIERRADGSLAIVESLALLRWSLVVCALAIGAGALALTSGAVEVALATREWLVLGGVGLASSAGALWAPTTTIEIAPWAQRIRWRRSRLLGARDRQIPFSEVRAVQVVAQRTQSDRGRPIVSYRIVLDTAGGWIPLSVVDLRNESESIALAERIRGLIGLSSASDVEARIRKLVASGHSIEAVTLARQHFDWDLGQAEVYVREIRAGRV